jgi:hypothetical protein
VGLAVGGRVPRDIWAGGLWVVGGGGVGGKLEGETWSGEGWGLAWGGFCAVIASVTNNKYVRCGVHFAASDTYVLTAVQGRAFLPYPHFWHHQVLLIATCLPAFVSVAVFHALTRLFCHPACLFLPACVL